MEYSVLLLLLCCCGIVSINGSVLGSKQSDQDIRNVYEQCCVKISNLESEVERLRKTYLDINIKHRIEIEEQMKGLKHVQVNQSKEIQEMAENFAINRNETEEQMKGLEHVQVNQSKEIQQMAENFAINRQEIDKLSEELKNERMALRQEMEKTIGAEINKLSQLMEKELQSHSTMNRALKQQMSDVQADLDSTKCLLQTTRSELVTTQQTLQSTQTALNSSQATVYKLTDQVNQLLSSHQLGSSVPQSMAEEPSAHDCDGPLTTDQELHVKMEPEAVYNATTDQWHTVLTCGQFTAPDYPPVTIVWETPSGLTHLSNVYADGLFKLQLPNPAPGGSYTCRISGSSLKQSCLHGQSLQASVLVDSILARLSTMEAQQRQLRQDNQKKDNLIEHMSSKLESLIESQSADTGSIQNDLTSVRSQIDNHTGDISDLRSQIDNHTVDISDLRSQIDNRTDELSDVRSQAKVQEKEVVTIQNDLQSVRTKLGNQSATMAMIKKDLSSQFTKQTDGIAAITDDLSTRMLNQSAEVQRFGRELSVVRAQVRKQSSEAAAMKTSMSSLHEEQRNQSSQVGSMWWTLSDMNVNHSAALLDIWDDLQDVKSAEWRHSKALEEIRSKVSILRSEITNQSAAVGAVRDDMWSLATNSTSQLSDLRTLGDRLSAAETELVNMSTTMVVVQDDLSSLTPCKAEVSALKSNLSVLWSAVDTQTSDLKDNVSSVKEELSSHLNGLVDIHFPSNKISLDVHNTPTTVYFNVTSRCNADLSNYRLDIRTSDGSHPDMDSGGGSPLCSIRPGGVADGCNGRCESTDSGLSCQATETFPRRPHRTWQVSGSVGCTFIAKVEVFDVTYPELIQDFAVLHHNPPYQAGRTYLLQCSWSEGNPRRKIELRGPENQTLRAVDASPDRNTSLRHALKNVDCRHSGQYRCGVEGGPEFKSLTFLVKCPLEIKNKRDVIQRYFDTGSDVVFTFDVTSYTTDFTSCQLTRPSMTIINCEDNANSDVTVEGSPPFFKLKVTLKDIGNDAEGIWTLAVSNAMGSPDTVSFQLTASTSPCHPDNHDVIDDPRRLTSNGEGRLCDNKLQRGWYRFMVGGSNAAMPTSCDDVRLS